MRLVFFVYMLEKTLRVEAVEPRPGLLLSSAFQLSFVFWRRLPHKYRQEQHRSRGRTAK